MCAPVVPASKVLYEWLYVGMVVDVCNQKY